MFRYVRAELQSEVQAEHQPDRVDEKDKPASQLH